MSISSFLCKYCCLWVKIDRSIISSIDIKAWNLLIFKILLVSNQVNAAFFVLCFHLACYGRVLNLYQTWWFLIVPARVFASFLVLLPHPSRPALVSNLINLLFHLTLNGHKPASAQLFYFICPTEFNFLFLFFLSVQPLVLLSAAPLLFMTGSIFAFFPLLF